MFIGANFAAEAWFTAALDLFYCDTSHLYRNVVTSVLINAAVTSATGAWVLSERPTSGDDDDDVIAV